MLKPAWLNTLISHVLYVIQPSFSTITSYTYKRECIYLRNLTVANISQLMSRNPIFTK